MFEKIILRDLSIPLAKRKGHSPYYWCPSPSAKGGIGFYSSSQDALAMDRAGSPVNLRLEWANDHIEHSWTARTIGYHASPYGDGDTIQPIIARLPVAEASRGRGFLAGWTMGAGMCGTLEPEIYSEERDAAYVAHSIAERAADREREEEAKYQAVQRIEDAKGELAIIRRDVLALIVEAKGKVFGSRVCAALRQHVTGRLSERRALFEEIEELEKDYWSVIPC